MKRAFWTRSLSGQLILVMLLAVALSQGISMLVYRAEHAYTVGKVVQQECLGRAFSAYRLAQSVPAGQRAEVLEKTWTPLTRYWYATQPPGDPAEWQLAAKTYLLQPVTSVSVRVPKEDKSLFHNQPMLEHLNAADWQVVPADGALLRRPAQVLALKKWNGFGIAIELDDGTWVNTAFAKPDYLVQPTFTPGYYVALGVTALIFCVTALFIARRVSRPLRRLEEGAERLGRGEELEVLPEEGPDDIRGLIRSFNRMQTRLRRFLEDRTRMLGAIGHDLRTPITSMRLRAEYISDHETREKMMATLDEMHAMTEAALAFARSESATESTRVVDLEALLGSLCDDLSDLGWQVEFAGNGARLPLACRPEALRRAVRNVVENAIRYGDKAKVSLQADAEGADITVEDEGPGIPEADRERVFSPFVRLEASRNRDTGGVGLGLSIARTILRGHGGDIQLADGPSGLRVQMHVPRGA
jgi:signal transduction histidine kinase